MKQKLYELTSNPTTTKWRKFVSVLSLLYNNIGYGYYFLTTLLLLFGLFNPFMDTLVLVV
jgi:hypothetical protein